MVEYHITTFYNGGNNAGRTVVRRRWDAAHAELRSQVYAATEGQGLRDREAGWNAHHAAIAVAKLTAGNCAEVDIGAHQVLIEAVA